MSLIPSMSFDKMMEYTTKDNEQAKITVGIIRNGNMSYTVYGNNASVLPKTEYSYEIGSLTKTFTASMLAKAISEGKIDLNDQISKYIDLPEKEYYPTLRRLVTHTSGYKNYYFEWQMVSNFLNKQENDYYGVNNLALTNKIAEIELKDSDYDFKYSNFGFAVLGNVLSNVYDSDYHKLMDDFIIEDLHLYRTKLYDGTRDLDGYWNWKENDAYLSAGAITSTIGDMMKYINLQMVDQHSYLSLSQEILAEIHASSSQYEKMDIRMDDIGMGWILDTKNNVMWHNGGTSNFNCYAAFDKERQIGVVILSNCPPSDRIPSTVMGVKLMKQLQREADS